MRTILLLALIFGSVLGGPQFPALSFGDIVSFFKGFINKINAGGDFHNFHDCIVHVESTVPKINELVNSLKEVDWSSLESIHTFFVKFFDTFKDVFNAMSPCVKIGEDLTKFWEIVQKQDLGSVAHKAMKHLFDLFCAVTDCLMYWQNGQYEKAGEQLGDAVYLLLLKKEPELPKLS
eukprot:TRINITY_DN7849_c0_g1_i11.p1 TRINITY_DN7849_c0_g1~~TRINITY_DN7849_c0_g1_i11.p1  ORF type:complete len:177 (+),score=65.63 TRINITY_DN7849_c0_g1_i11:311-841(+)